MIFPTSSFDLSKIKSSKLILTSGNTSLISNISTSLLINKLQFERIGIYFSEYSQQDVYSFNNQLHYNGDVYYNQDYKLLIFEFISSIPKSNRLSFFNELDQFIKDNSIIDVLLIGGLVPENLSDFEIQSKEPNLYYLSNQQTPNEKVKEMDGKVICFREKVADVFDLKKERFYETKYLNGLGFGRYYIKYKQYKNEEYRSLLLYGKSLVDINAGVRLYKALLKYFEIFNEDFENVCDEETLKYKKIH